MAKRRRRIRRNPSSSTTKSESSGGFGSAVVSGLVLVGGYIVGSWAGSVVTSSITGRYPILPKGLLVPGVTY